MRLARVLVTCLAVFQLSSSASANEGVWVKAGPPAQINVFCTQVWHCRAKNDILHSADTLVIYSDNQITKGTCSAAGGPIDSCNECLAAEPAEPCTYRLEKR